MTNQIQLIVLIVVSTFVISYVIVSYVNYNFIFNTTEAACNPENIEHWNKYVFRSVSVIAFEGDSSRNIVPTHYYELITKQNPNTIIDVSEFIMDELANRGYMRANPMVIEIINISYSTPCVAFE